MNNDDKKRIWAFVSEALHLDACDDCSQIEFDFEPHKAKPTNDESRDVGTN